MTKRTAIAAAALAVATIAGCSSDADVVSSNISKDADQFKITRRIVFYNGITDKYMLEIQGKCNFDPHDSRVDVTCKMPNGDYKKNTLGLSDNVTFFAEQIEPSAQDPDHYTVIFKPEAIVPNIVHP